MGKILKLHNKGNNVEVTLEMSRREVEWLNGNMEDMHVFSEKNIGFLTRLVQRGKRESTKYFLMPKDFKGDTDPSNQIFCTRIETKKKFIYLFQCDKT